MTPRILIVAGSDSGGGAGIQADIKTVTMLGGHAMTAVTAITAQNTLGVQAVHPVPTDIVVAQMRSVIDDIGVDAIKIGMIGSAETAHAVADVLEGLARATPTRHPGLEPGSRFLSPEGSGTPGQARGDEKMSTPASIPIVFDPVMVATSGAMLADTSTIAAFERLMRLATLVTPNIAELVKLTDGSPGNDAWRQKTSSALAVRVGTAILSKGGDEHGKDLLTDFLTFPDGKGCFWTSERIETRHTHGTGCTLASGIATGLARNIPIGTAIDVARQYVLAALAHAPGLGDGHGPMGHGLGQPHFEVLCPA